MTEVQENILKEYVKGTTCSADISCRFAVHELAAKEAVRDKTRELASALGLSDAVLDACQQEGHARATQLINGGYTPDEEGGGPRD